MKPKLIIGILFWGLFIFPASGKSVAPDFTLPSLDNKQYSLRDFQGKVVVLNFWASWCPECIKEMPSLEKFHRQYKDRGVVVIGISVDKSAKAAAKVVQKLGLTYLNLIDKNGDVFIEGFRVIGLPTTIVIGPDRTIEKKIIGSTEFDSDGFKNYIERLLRR